MTGLPTSTFGSTELRRHHLAREAAAHPNASLLAELTPTQTRRPQIHAAMPVSFTSNLAQSGDQR